MNLLILTYQGDIAGSTESIRFLCEGLADRGHTVVMGCRRESLLYQKLEGTKVICEAMTFRSKLDWKNMRQIRDAVRKYDIDIINAQSSLDRYTAILANWIFRLGVKVVHTRRQRVNASGGFLQRWFYHRGTDAMIAVSEGVKQGLMKTGIPESYIHVIHNGTPAEKYQNISPSKVAALRTTHEIRPGEIVIGCISRRKRQEQILQAANRIEIPLVILFVGIGEDERLKKLRSDLGDRHRVIYTGMVSGKMALHHFPLLTIDILPSLIEGLSQSLLEAMALGVPVIATRAGGNPELIRDGHNGFLFDDGDIDSLEQRIHSLLTDQQLRNRMIENGKKTALVEFNIENTIRKHEVFFRQLINN